MLLKFLIVDDSKAMRTIVKRILISAGYADHDFRFSENGSDAIKQIVNWQPDMVLLDWHMPEITGIQVLEKVKELGLPTKIGLITAEKNPHSIKAAREAGAIFVVNKPFTMDELKDSLIPALAGVSTFQDTLLLNEKGIIFPSPSALSNILSTIVGKDISIEVIKKQRLSQFNLPGKLSLFGDGDGKTKAVQMLDSKLCDRLSESFCSSVYRNDAIDDKLLAKALLRSLTIIAACFYDIEKAKELNLAKTFTVQKLIEKVQSLDELDGLDRLDLKFTFSDEQACYGSFYSNTNELF